eukprot:CAMPEP_0185760188 /NCGR_PEP_ID=MMETSP1174-20130828/19035_1 /TAXON_ID=35687 /ORGANISM="Dictyocha speculum, Strain CCMP1381" /LENGTH=276 /DNA_ID=CAMNT_0028440893 /DNA_START=40 /DNA_END=870 /DNA_ORIENTATION=+
MEVLLTRIGRVSLAAAGTGFVANNVLYSVDGGQRAVIFDRFQGVLPDARSEGTHLKIPFIQDPIIFDIRSRAREVKSITGTKDLQMVNIWLRILSRPQEEHLSEIYQQLGTNFDDRVLPSIVNEVLKGIVAKYDAVELLSKRQEISTQIRLELEKRAGGFHLTLDDVSITHLVYGKEFTNAIEQKQVAQQEAERQHWVVAKADQERQAAIIRAEGESEAATIVTKALQDCGSGLIEVRRIDTAKEIAGMLAQSRNITYLPNTGGGGAQMLLGLNNA